MLRCYERVVFSRQAAAVEDGGAIPVWGDGTAVRSYTYVTDMVDGIYRLPQISVEENTGLRAQDAVAGDPILPLFAAFSRRLKADPADS